MGGTGAIAIDAGSANDERVPRHLELVLPANFFNRGLDGRVLKLDHLLANTADKMLVLRVAVVVLVIGFGPDFQLAQHAGIDEFRQRPIDGCPANVEPGFFEILAQLIGIEVAMVRKNLLDQIALLVGKPLGRGPTDKVFAEFFNWRLSDLNGRQRHDAAPQANA